MIAIATPKLQVVQSRYPEASLRTHPDGGDIVHIPLVPLVPGWSLVATPVWFLVPPGFPAVRPDCFFADADLTLKSGGEPQSSSIQVLEGTPKRWFSWHLATWDGTRDGLIQFVRFIERRLADAR